ncbi:MAG: efflux RND transporter permease subunit, partial [Bacteroidota bacterium]
MKLPILAINNYHFTITLLLLVVLIGVVSFLGIPKSEDPLVEEPLVFVQVISKGTSTEDLEKLVVDPAESALFELEDVDEILSETSDGKVVIHISFEGDETLQERKDQVQNRMNAVRNSFPPSVTEVNVISSSILNVTAFQIALYGDSVSNRHFESESKRLKKTLQRISGVAKVEVYGLEERVALVSTDFKKLNSHQLTLNDVAASIAQANVIDPIGNINLGQQGFEVITGSGINYLEDLRNVGLRSQGNELTTLDQISEIDYSVFKTSATARYNGSKAVYLTITLKKGYGIFEVEEKVEKVLTEFDPDTASGIQTGMVFNQAVHVDERISSLYTNFVQGSVLLGICLIFFIGLRASSLILLSVPISLLMSIALLDLMDLGLQQISIAGLVISMGLLVDNGIAVMENIIRFRNLGLSKTEAAIQGCSEIGWPLFTSAITTMLSFFPMLFIEGSTGEFLRSLPLTVIFAIGSSLLVSLTIMPLLSVR